MLLILFLLLVFWMGVLRHLTRTSRLSLYERVLGNQIAQLVTKIFEIFWNRYDFHKILLYLQTTFLVDDVDHIKYLVHDGRLVLLGGTGIQREVKVIHHILNCVHVDQTRHSLANTDHLRYEFDIADKGWVKVLVWLVPCIFIVPRNFLHLDQLLVEKETVSRFVVLHYLEHVVLANSAIIRDAETGEDHFLVALGAGVKHIVYHLDEGEDVCSKHWIELCLKENHKFLSNIFWIAIFQKLLKSIAIETSVLFTNVCLLETHSPELVCDVFVIYQIQIIYLVANDVDFWITHTHVTSTPLLLYALLFEVIE